MDMGASKKLGPCFGKSLEQGVLHLGDLIGSPYCGNYHIHNICIYMRLAHRLYTLNPKPQTLKPKALSPQLNP